MHFLHETRSEKAEMSSWILDFKRKATKLKHSCLLEICRNAVGAWGNKAQMKWKRCFQPDGTKENIFFFLISYQLPPPNQSPEHENSSIQCQCICYSCLNVRRKWKLEWGTGSRSRWVWGADVPCQGEGVYEMIKPGWPGQPTLGTVAAGTGNNSSFSALLMWQHSWVHLSTRPQQLFKGKEKGVLHREGKKGHKIQSNKTHFKRPVHYSMSCWDSGDTLVKLPFKKVT